MSRTGILAAVVGLTFPLIAGCIQIGKPQVGKTADSGTVRVEREVVVRTESPPSETEYERESDVRFRD